MYFFFTCKKPFLTGPPEYRSKHLFLSFSKIVTESYLQSEYVAETVLMMPMAPDTKLKWFRVHLIAKNQKLHPGAPRI